MKSESVREKRGPALHAAGSVRACVKSAGTCSARAPAQCACVREKRGHLLCAAAGSVRAGATWWSKSKKYDGGGGR